MPSMSIARWLTGEKIRTEFGNPMVAGTPARGIVAHRRGVSNLRALDRGAYFVIGCWPCSPPSSSLVRTQAFQAWYMGSNPVGGTRGEPGPKPGFFVP